SDVCSSDLGDRHPACDHAERGGSVGQATGMREVHDGLCEEDQCGGGEGEHGGEKCERGDGEEEFSFHRAALRRACRWMRVSAVTYTARSEEHTSELQSRENLVCRLLLATTK